MIIMNSTGLSGLRILIFYHKLIGITYWGSTIDGKQTFIKRLSQIIWNIIIILIAIFHCTVITIQFISNLSQNNTNNSFIIDFVLNFSYICYTIQTIFNVIFLMFKSNAILNHLKIQTNIMINDRSERKIGLYITITQFIVSLVSCLLSLIFIKIHHNHFDMAKVYPMWVLFITLFTTYNYNYTIISLIAYKFIVISRHLENSFVLNSSLNINSIHQNIHEIYNSVKEFDNYVSIYLLFNLIIHSFDCISGICILALGINTVIILTLFSAIYSFLFLLFSCLISDMISKSLRKLINRIEIIFINQNNIDFNSLYNRIILNQIEKYENNICLSAMNLFNVNTKTFISCLALIISYSVVLIQTTQTLKSEISGK